MVTKVTASPGGTAPTLDGGITLDTGCTTSFQPNLITADEAVNRYFLTVNQNASTRCPKSSDAVKV